jgi:hypothetical protein
MYRDMAAQGPVRTILGALLGALVGLALVPALLWGIGKLFGGEGGYFEFVKSYGHVSGLLGLLGAIPCLGGFIAVIWTIATVPVQLMVIHRLPMGKAIGVTAITYGLFLIAFCGLAFMNAAAQMATGAFAG